MVNFLVDVQGWGGGGSEIGTDTFFRTRFWNDRINSGNGRCKIVRGFYVAL